MPATYSFLHYHLIFATKGRAPVFDKPFRERLHPYLAGTVKGLGGIPVSINGVEDHAHLLVSLKTSHCLADFVRDLKKASSSWIRNEKRDFAWQEGYGVFSVGPKGVGAVKAYIEHQEEHHRKVDSREELLRLCREAGVDVDMRYFE